LSLETPLPHRIALGVEYDGAAFHGWQQQGSPVLPTVQARLEAALSEIASHPVKLTCAGRTDTGVHGTGQVVHFDCAVDRGEKAWRRGGNSLLPPSLRIVWAKTVPADFHARFSAQSRRYLYVIYDSPVEPAVLARHLTHTREALDIDAMHTAGARGAVDGRKNEVLPLAGLVELLWLAGEQKEATERMTQLREVAGRADLDVPALQRLAPVVQALGLPADWRMQRPPSTDVGARPDLATLGPYRWTPSAAPEWALKDAQGTEHLSSHWRGKPVVLIFYLGSGCLHCAQQLQAFSPLAKEYEQAGIGLLAISTDDVEGLKKSLASVKEGEFAIPLLTDAPLQVFKAFRVHDDFENKPLHGTFFIDGNGLVRWQDIGHEPFQDARFVLNEAKRLLALPAAPTGTPVPAPSAPLVGAQAVGAPAVAPPAVATPASGGQ